MREGAKEPRSGNRTQRLFTQMKRCRVHCGSSNQCWVRLAVIENMYRTYEYDSDADAAAFGGDEL